MRTTTIGEYLVAYCASRYLRPNTVISYRFAIRGIEHEPITSLDAALIASHAKRLLNRKSSPHTVKARVGVLCVLWRSAIDDGATATPFKRPAMPRAPKVIVRATSPEDIAKLVAYCESLRGTLRNTKIPKSLYWSAFIAALYETALRTSDMLQLRFNDRGEWHITQVKTQRPITVSVSATTLDRMRRLADCSPKLFDLGWHREWYCRGVALIARRAGLGEITPQQLRRSAGSEVERQQPGAGWIALGHSSPATTLGWYIDRIYSHSSIPKPRLPGPEPPAE